MVDEVFLNRNPERIWQKYCGFLNLNLKEFLEIQFQLLLEQLEIAYNSELGRKFMHGKPRSISEFRKVVPLSTYSDYIPFFTEKNDSVMAKKPYCWARTSGHGGISKWVPFTEEYLNVTSMLVISAAILASADRRGEVKIENGMRVLHNLPPVPYGVGYFARNISNFIDVSYMPDLTSSDKGSFEARTREGFKEALSKGVDILSSLSSVLIKMGEHFEENGGQVKIDSGMLIRPRAAARLLLAKFQSQREKRPVMPKDLWPLRGLISYGMDTDIYRDRLVSYWGKEPLQIYAATESGIMATQSWNKKGMTFTPHSAFYEFIPEEEWLRSRQDKNYRPMTVLMDQVQPGKKYEVVITSFYGMPFLRYRIGDLIKFVSLEDVAAGIKLPQMIFESRADGIIDIASFARLDEKTIWQAIASTGIKYEDWCVRKEYENKEPILRLYIELRQEADSEEVRRCIHKELRSLNTDYDDLDSMLGMQPLRVKLVIPGSFQHYYETRQMQGADLAHLKPPHMNASDKVIQELTGVVS